MKTIAQRLLIPLLIGAAIMAIGYGFAGLLRGDLCFSNWPLALQSVVVVFALFAAVMSGVMIFGARAHR